ncbi:MAG TPA: ABC transporter ATP-binding protein [Pyrinomonadaceae bacterium]|nr:ABC transporter ATP-binding protein [Pyrinomonadaceae bacterium]
MTTVVEITDLTKDYEIGFLRKRRVRALDRLSLTVNANEIFGFLGANGAGKTTTLKILMSLIFPTAGRAQILGHDIADVSMHRRIGYLPENPYFYDYLTAREFLMFCASLFSYKKDEQFRRAASLLNRVRLDEKKWDTQLRKFSKGMLQRVGLAQALVNDPEIVFLDEPMSGLDPIGRRQVRDLIAELRAEGKTVFMCSHILSDIEVLCDRVAILKRGRLANIGYLNELRQQVGDEGTIEILTSGIDQAQLKPHLKVGNEYQVSAVPGGVRVQVKSESEVDDVIAALRKANGKLLSVQPVRQSLEELFVGENPDKSQVT